VKRKFKVGDIIFNIKDFSEEHKYEIIAIVEGLEEFEGNWISGEQREIVLNSYLVKICEFSEQFNWKLTTIGFCEEKLFRCIHKIENPNGEWNTICTCGAPAFVSLFSITCAKGCVNQYC
jgi:hypothetical protein